MNRRKAKVKEIGQSELLERLAGGERRGDARVPARLEVELPLGSWAEARRVYTSNISHGGLLFSLEAPASVPAEVDLHVTLPDGHKLTLVSEVRHVARREGSDEYDVGVQFQALDAVDRKIFEDALRQASG
jgi:c-di-GMP-binding flagellar brake protein YcgR